jgi:hypothetical protein
MAVGEYECQHRGRSDAVYRAKLSGGFKRLLPNFHSSEIDYRRDTSAPVLVFDLDATWYFGGEPHMLPEHLMHLAASGRGHRVNGANEVDAATLQAWLASISPPGIHGVPRDYSSTNFATARWTDIIGRVGRLFQRRRAME